MSSDGSIARMAALRFARARRNNGDDVTRSGTLVRSERPGDYADISDLTKRAFAPMSYASGKEHVLIEALRQHGALSVSLVAIEGGELVGHVAFSPAKTSDSSSPWYALGPIAVEPKMQMRGIGSLLILEGITWLRSMNVAGCILVGEPKYYARFGFAGAPDLAPDGVPPEFFMVLPLSNTEPRSVITFHPLFHEIA
jgi:predicted N-acetyltransferase YhbS